MTSAAELDGRGPPGRRLSPSLLAAANGPSYLFFFELVWMSIWLIVVALPLWSAHQPMDAKISETVLAWLMGVIFPAVIPWRYVVANYVRRPGIGGVEGSNIPVGPLRRAQQLRSFGASLFHL